ncbi:MAG TPA: L-aspartate oxidase [Gemmatimonadales bacterium]|jgi:L-aspartate oxidase|nr:L-aspartate oxidase [Gemmatimonadales bacterium]
MASTLIIGTGISGLWAAWRLAVAGRRSVLLTKADLADSASAWAQGGIAAALDVGDSPELHLQDTLAASGGTADPAAVRILVTEGPDRIRELIQLGAAFDRGPDGQVRFGLEGGHSRSRILHAWGDRTGAAVVACLVAIVRDHPLVEIRERTEVRHLLTEAGRVIGVEVDRGVAPSEPLYADEVVLATGGVGQLFAVTTNPLVATGDGWALAFEAGAGLEDLEYLQFHPTALKLEGVNPAPLLTEALRGAGAYLVDRAGARFALRADPRGELAPRDLVARAVAAADAEGGAWLDARHLPEVTARFPGVAEKLGSFGLDLARDLIPIAPALHYAMGGVATDLDGRTSLPGLWAIGEVACTGVHGANRLASNSLLEGMVFADRAARAIAATPPRPGAAPPPFVATPDHGADAQCEPVRRKLRETMTAHVGLQRTEAGLARAYAVIAELEAETPGSAWRTRHQLLVARLIVRHATHHRESRGGHLRLDYPPVPAATV